MSDPTQPQKRSKDLVVVVAVIVAVGLVGAIWWTKWFLPVRASSQDKVVLGNLRQIQAAADQYFLEHDGVTSVATVTVVGTNSTQYDRNFVTVAQETYSPIIVQGAGISAMGVAGARTVTYGP